MKIKNILFALLLIVTACSNPKVNYLDPNVPLDARVNDLLSQMTPEEKDSQMVYKTPAIERLKVPAYNWWSEGLHGAARNGLCTVFPQAIGLAATWDKELMHRVASAISDEARAKYNIAISKGQHGRYQGLTYWSPNINIFRDPRWGRGMETYGEDPFLTGQMAVQFIKGMQGDDPKYYKVIATAKHFAVHSGPEPDRHTFDVLPSEYDLRETYLPAFKMSVVDGKVGSLMCAYNSLRGNACCSNDPLLNKILRDEWHFTGYVVSDCGAIDDIYNGHKQAKDGAEASAKAVKAGTDLECGRTYLHLNESLKRGLITSSEIDVSMKRLLTARFKLGMFDPPDMVPYSKLGLADVDSKEHHDLAVESARKSIVLLKNQNNTLPLKKDVKTIAVIGPNANDVPLLLANYNGFPSAAVTPLDGIRRKVSAQTKVLYEPGCEVADGVPLMEPISYNYLFTSADKKQHGLKGEYFNGNELKGEPAATKIDSVIDLNWNTSLADFSVRWTGYVVPPLTGKYNIGLWSGNDFKVYLDDSLLFADNNDIDNDYSCKEMNLEKGKAYKIKVEVWVNAPKSQMQLQWALPDNEREKRAIDAAKKSDVVIMYMGLSPRLEGEEMDVKVAGFSGGDRVTIDLPATQEKLIKDIVATGKPVVLVLVNGSAVSINWENDNVPAIVESWYAGQAAGDAIADVLFGDYNPGARLPVTFYKSVDQIPAFKDYSMKGRTYRYFNGDVLYPFGYGLSYTTFAYSNPKTETTGDKMTCSVDVKNTGAVAGEEVVQLYVKGKGTQNNDAIKSLKGFERISLNPNETKTVTFEVSPETFDIYVEGKGFTHEKGAHTVLVGSSSADKDLHEVNVEVK